MVTEGDQLVVGEITVASDAAEKRESETGSGDRTHCPELSAPSVTTFKKERTW